MSNNKVKMHQIRFRLGLRPRPYTGSLQRSPNPPAGFKGPTFKLREGRGKEWREGKKRGEEKGKGEKLCSSKNFLEYVLRYAATTHLLYKMATLEWRHRRPMPTTQVPSTPSLPWDGHDSGK